MRRRSLLIFACLVGVLAISAATAAAAGPGIKFETVGFHSYTGVGFDYEFNIPDIPGVYFGEAVGWLSLAKGQPTHGQIGVGARFFLDGYADGSYQAPGGLFAEAKFRLFARGFHPKHDLEFSRLLLLGGGFRSETVLNGLDILLSVRLTKHHVVPDVMLGARVAF